jgi:uncharacterized DUF497 family protein
MRFEWDAAKAALNLKTHGISFDEAVEVFFDPNAVEGFDAQHSNDEDRFYIIGFSTRRLLYVVYAERLQGELFVLFPLAKRREKSKKNMKKDDKDTTFRFGIVEENGKDIMIEVTEEDYRRQLAAGVSKDEMLSVGFHKARRGGFRERHPNFSLENVEIRVTNSEQSAPLAKNDKEKKAA